jgi:hypothetical protein
MRYTKMQAKFGSNCANPDCKTEIKVSDQIFYSREAGGAFCVQCGQAKFEPKSFTPKPVAQSAPPVVAVMPYTFSKGCYCALVGAPCGYCVAQGALAEDVAKAKTITA